MSLLAQINNAAHTGAFGHNPRSEPTLAQLAAGNYKKGVVMVKGLSIAIENPAYTYRKGMDKTGQQWMCLMQAHYGYIQGYKGNDGDDMDVFIGVAPENDTVYIVNQKTADGYFDEHKIMLGFLSQQQAVDTYQHCFERGMTGLMSVVPCTMTQFKWWLANGDKSRPVTLDRLPYAGLERLDSVNWGGTDGSNLYSHDGQVHKLLYQIRQCDDTHQALEPLAYHDMIAELGNQGFMYENYDALIVEYNKLEKKAKQLLMVMQGAADTVKPVGVTVSKPLTKGGVANVVAWFEMDDGQAVGVFFHNPDKTPKKINPTDEMISYKWVLNKKDITIAVAPEQGKDLIIRTVAKRIMLLVEKNHDRFIKANGDKAALNQAEQDLSAQVAEKQATLKGLQDDVAALHARKAEKEAAQLAQERVIEPVVQEPEATLSNRFAEHDAIAKQYGYSVNSSGVIFTPKGKNTGVKIDSPTGRLKISNAKELLFSGVNPTGLGKFLESYWYAEKTKAVVEPTIAAEQSTDDGRITPDTAGNMKNGDIVRTKDGTEFMSLGARHDWLEVAPMINGKPQVNNVDTFKFLLSPEKASAYPERRNEPIYQTGKNYYNDNKGQEPVVPVPTPAAKSTDLTGRPSNWRTNLANARAVAKSLGIETKGKKLANLVGAIDEDQTTQPVSETVTQPVQTPVVPTPTPAAKSTDLSEEEYAALKKAYDEFNAKTDKIGAAKSREDALKIATDLVTEIPEKEYQIRRAFSDAIRNNKWYGFEINFPKQPVKVKTDAELNSTLKRLQKALEGTAYSVNGKFNYGSAKLKLTYNNGGSSWGNKYADKTIDQLKGKFVVIHDVYAKDAIEWMKPLVDGMLSWLNGETVPKMFLGNDLKWDTQIGTPRVIDDAFKEAKAKAAPVTQPEPTPATVQAEPVQPAIESPTPNPDRDYLQSIIDGEADLSNGDDVEAKLTDISERLDAELEPMFEQAAEAFAQYAIAQAATV